MDREDVVEFLAILSGVYLIVLSTEFLTKYWASDSGSVADPNFVLSIVFMAVGILMIWWITDRVIGA